MGIPFLFDGQWWDHTCRRSCAYGLLRPIIQALTQDSHAVDSDPARAVFHRDQWWDHSCFTFMSTGWQWKVENLCVWWPTQDSYASSRQWVLQQRKCVEWTWQWASVLRGGDVGETGHCNITHLYTASLAQLAIDDNCTYWQLVTIDQAG